MARTIHGFTYRSTEWPLVSGKRYPDPFNHLTVDVDVSDEKGRIWRVPAYWAGGDEWRVRFAPPHEGTYTWQARCSDPGNDTIQEQTGTIEVERYDGDNPLLSHGFPRVSEDRRHFRYADGTPFFWLGDTWWMGLCKRLHWPDDFQLLASDRRELGFTVIQLVMGLYPDMPAFDERGANEAGYPWEEGFSRINPAYFDMADLRIQWLVREGLAPCIVGCWGYYLPWMGLEKMKLHWRYIVARYSAYPVFWCLAGEATMPYYNSNTPKRDAEIQKRGWTQIARYVRSIDPYGHPITIHPTRVGREQVDDPALLDFDMLQTGHGDRASIPSHVQTIRQSLSREPKMPVVVGEVCYEGILEASRSEIQRFMFWTTILLGGGGHTYGANGIWQVNTVEVPFGPSPHGSSWGDTPWEEAYRLPGGRHVSVGKSILERYPWWRFEPMNEHVRPRFSEQDYLKPYAAGIDGEVLIVFLPSPAAVNVKGIDASKKYRAMFVDPKNGKEYSIGTIDLDKDSSWQSPTPPIFQDWLLILEAE